MDRIFDWVSIIGYSVQVKFLHTIGNQGELLRLPCYRHPQQNLPDHLSRRKTPEESPGLWPNIGFSKIGRKKLLWSF
jgi:hypothetical protein